MGKSMRSIITHDGQPFFPLPYFILNDKFGHPTSDPHMSVTIPIIRTQKNDELDNFHTGFRSIAANFLGPLIFILSPSPLPPQGRENQIYTPSPLWGEGGVRGHSTELTR